MAKPLIFTVEGGGGIVCAIDQPKAPAPARYTIAAPGVVEEVVARRKVLLAASAVLADAEEDELIWLLAVKAGERARG